MTRFTLILILFGLFQSIAFTQDKKQNFNKLATEKALLAETFEDAEFFFEQQDYKEALFNFLKISEKMPDNGNINYRIGMCYLNIPGEEIKAIPYLEKAKSKISTKYKKSSLEETKAPLFMLYYLGNAYRINNQTTLALEVYRKFLNHPEFKYNVDMVENEIAACERAKLIQDNPIELTFNNLGELINNSNSNRRPVVTPDENVIIYLSALKFYDAIFMARKENGNWLEPENISAQIGTDGDCEPACISADGKELFLIKKKKDNFDIFVSSWVDGLWTPMKALNKNINSSKMETGCSLSPDGLTLYFSSDRRGGQGGLDIYMSERKHGEDWGPAKNLGKTVNSDQDDNLPFICEDGKTLWFASDGHLSMGGYDIFITSLLPDGKWDIPANAGYPINTSGSNNYWYPIKNGEVAYAALFRDEGFGQEDIYRIENNTLVARNSATENSSVKTRRVIVRNKLTNQVVGALFYDKDPSALKLEKSSEFIEVNIGN